MIPALDCPEELALIQKGLSGCRGIESLSPNFLHRSLTVTFDADQIAPAAIAEQLRNIGFPPEAAAERSSAPEVVRPLRTTMWLSGVLLAAAVACQILAIDSSWIPFFSMASCILSGWPVTKAAWRALRLWRLDMNALMVIAAVGAIATAPRTGEWTEAPTALFLFGLSLWLESYSLGRARKAVQTLIEIAPTVAHRLGPSPGCHHKAAMDHVAHEAEQDKIEDIPTDRVHLGERILVRPGERVPVDGVVIAGESAMNESTITGESAPEDFSTGDIVFAGSMNGEGALELRVTKPAHESTLAHIARLVEQAEAARSPTERFVDAFARRYTPAVILLAIVVACGPPLAARLGILEVGVTASNVWFDWLHRGLVLLVIACPCALVISTPVTIVCGLRQATKFGLLVKGGQFLELAGKIDCVAFDKTGTLTEANPRVVQIRPLSNASADEILTIAASLETKSEHPLARAIVEAATDRHLPLRVVEQFTVHRGAGVQGSIAGETYFVASRRFFVANQVDGALPDEHAAALNNKISAMQICVGTQRKLLGEILLDDEPRSDAAQAVSELHALGISPIVMLTGDSRAAAQRVAERTSVDEFHAELLPADKVEQLRCLASRHHCLAMVGDGVNDAPALATASVGIAFGSHASATALETADVVVLSRHLTRIPELIRLGRRTRALLRQNIAIAIGIKLAVLLLAVLGHANLWLAVGADVGASMVVIFNGMRLLRRVGQVF